MLWGVSALKYLFFKNLIFLDFRSIELVAWPNEIAIKNLVWIYLARSMLDWSNVIFDWLNLFFYQSKIVQRVFFFLKHEFFTCSSLFNFSKSSILSLFDRSRLKTNFFCRFPSNFLQDFCLLVLVRLFFPFFFSLISFFMHLRENFEPMGFWDFWCFWCFLSKLINGFLLLDDINMILVV